MYAGAFDEPTSRYATKVFAERMRLEPSGSAPGAESGNR